MRTRGIVLVIFVLVVVAAIFAWKMFNPGPTAFAGSNVALADYRGGDPTGVPADLKNADIVKRGEYLARAADCRACHTVSRDRPYAGGLPLVLPFGTLYSTNITPDKETGIGNYSDQDFLNAVQRGIRPDGTRLYPAMPYPSYTRMTDVDALAIKAYLFSLPAVRAQNQPDTFSFPSDKGSGIGAWTDDEVRSYLSAGHASGRGTAAGPMGEAVDQSFTAIAPSDIRALVTYLRSVPAIASADLPAKLAPPAPDSPKQGTATAEAVGKRVFEGACVHCHNWTGVSQISPFATIAGTRGVNDRTATNVVQIVISGTTRHTPTVSYRCRPSATPIPIPKLRRSPTM